LQEMITATLLLNVHALYQHQFYYIPMSKHAILAIVKNLVPQDLLN